MVCRVDAVDVETMMIIIMNVENEDDHHKK